ncbi:acyl-CoA-binding protein homolog [Halictus rubicundus]|uniref:acyl-CoA-binding protein homolog n=1 Tax=Halictus rubicundus TaxID=77578 RepID=UPI0040355235
MSLDQKFEEAAEATKKFTKRPTDDELLKLYGLYKQGTTGDVNTSRPGMMDLKGKAKWDQWKSNEGMSKDKAKEEYIKLVDSLTAKYT